MATQAKAPRKAAVRSRGPTKAQLQELVGKAMTDMAFRKKLSADPVAAAEQLGIKFNDKQLAAVKAMTPEISKAAESLAKREEVACGPGVLIPIADVGIVSAFA